MISILAVEDNRPFLDALMEQLKPEFDISGAGSLAEARDALEAGLPDLLLLDVALPDGDGRTLCRELREGGHHFPILMLTASGGERDAITGLEAGANDYIVKPLRVGELVARIRVHLAAARERRDARLRIGGGASGTGGGGGGGFLFNPMAKTLTHEATGKVLPLTEKESAILRTLVDGKIMSKEELLKTIWGYGENISTHTLETHVYRLRRKIAEIGGEEILVTTRDGYGLKMD